MHVSHPIFAALLLVSQAVFAQKPVLVSGEYFHYAVLVAGEGFQAAVLRECPGRCGVGESCPSLSSCMATAGMGRLR